MKNNNTCYEHKDIELTNNSVRLPGDKVIDFYTLTIDNEGFFPVLETIIFSTFLRRKINRTYNNGFLPQMWMKDRRAFSNLVRASVKVAVAIWDILENDFPNINDKDIRYQYFCHLFRGRNLILRSDIVYDGKVSHDLIGVMSKELDSIKVFKNPYFPNFNKGHITSWNFIEHLVRTYGNNGTIKNPHLRPGFNEFSKRYLKLTDSKAEVIKCLLQMEKQQEKLNSNYLKFEDYFVV